MSQPDRYHPVAIQHRAMRRVEWHQDAIDAASRLPVDQPSTEAHIAGMRDQEPVVMLANQLSRLAELHLGRYGIRISESPQQTPPFLDLARVCRILADDSGDFDPGAVLEMIERALERGGFDPELNPLSD